MAVRAAWRDDLNEQLRDHRSDALAILLGVAGVIAALGIYSDLAGPFGRAIDHGTAAVLGGGRFLVPVALIIGALALIIPVKVDGDEGEDEAVERAGRGWRLGIGLALTLLSAVGLMHVGHGNPRRSIDALERAGGVVGALVGAPLRAGLGPAGAVIVLIALGALGVLLMVGTGLRQVGLGLTLGARFVGRQGRALLTMPTTAPETGPETVDLVAAELAGGPHDIGYEASAGRGARRGRRARGRGREKRKTKRKTKSTKSTKTRPRTRSTRTTKTNRRNKKTRTRRRTKRRTTTMRPPHRSRASSSRSTSRPATG